MSKILKISAISFGVFALLLIAAVMSLVILVNPERIKPILISEISKETGRQLTIDGETAWSFYPYLGVKVNRLTLGNPAQFTQKIFTEVASATVGVKLVPLLHGKIESSGIELKGMKLNLIKKADGTVNWNFQPILPAQSSVAENNPAAKNRALVLTIAGITIIDSDINFTDEQKKQTYSIDHVNFNAKNISLTHSFPIKADFDFFANQKAVSAHVTLASDFTPDLATQIFSFEKLKLAALIQQGNKKINLAMTGDLVTDLKRQELAWKNFQATLANIKMTGKLTVSQLMSSPLANGQIQFEPFDLKETFSSIGIPVTNLQSAKKVKINLVFTAGSKSIKATGDLSVATLQLSKLNFSNLKTKIDFQNGILNLTPITAGLYQGTLSAQAKISFKAVPQMSLQAKLIKVQSEPLFQDLANEKKKLTIAGTGNLTLQLTTSGSAAQSIIHNLKGTSQFAFADGTIKGIDLGYVIDSGYALLKRQPLPANNHQTNFGSLTGSVLIQNGEMTNNDLVSDSPRFKTAGKGTINLVDNRIKYSLETTLKKSTSEAKNNLMNMYGITVPVLVSGDLNHPSVRLDSVIFLSAIAKQQLKKMSDDGTIAVVQEKAADLLKGNAAAALNNLLGTS